MTRAALLATLALAVTAGTAQASTRMDTVAGGGNLTVDGVLATNTSIDGPIGVTQTGSALGGNFAVTDALDCLVRRVEVDSEEESGTAFIAAGNHICGGGVPFAGVPSNVPLSPVSALSRRFDGSFLIADTFNGMVHRWIDGIIVTVAGSGRSDDATECTPAAPANTGAALSAGLCYIFDVAAHPTQNGRFLLTESNSRPGGPRVYEVNAGTLTVASGGGCAAPSDTTAAVCYGTGGTTHLSAAWKADGMGYIVSDKERHIVRQFDKTDFATAVSSIIAGTKDSAGGSGDGGAASAALFSSPTDVLTLPDSSYLISDSGNCRVRRVSTVAASGIVSHFAGATPNGAGASECATTSTAVSQLGDGGFADQARLSHAEQLAAYPRGILIADKGTGRVRQVARTSILTSPAQGTATASDSATFTFDSALLNPSYECTLDTVAALCGNAGDESETYSSLSDGKHTFTVADIQAPGDPTPVQRTWTVDTTGPNDFALRDPADGATGQAPQPTFSWDQATDATTSVVDYLFFVDGSEVAGTGTCAESVCSGAPDAPLPEGTHTWRIRAVDVVGNTHDSATRTVSVGTPPVAVFAAAPNPVLAGRSVTFDGSGSTDANGPIARFEWDLDGDGAFETDTGATPAASGVYTAIGSVPISLRVTDGVGLQATTTVPLQVNTPIVGTQLGVSVNEGAQYTNDKAVKLLLKAPAGTTQVLVSNDGGFLAPTTFNPASEVDWTLDSSGPERLPKTVYVRFLLGPIVSETFTDDIILDETAPVVKSASVTPPAGTASIAAKKRFTVKVKATDSNSGVDRVQITSNKKKPGKLLKYKTKLTVKSSSKPKYLRARDRAGNYSRWKKLR